MKPKILIPVGVFFIILTLISFNVFRAYTGPHGGIVKIVGNYKIEMKKETSKLYFFLLTKNSKPIANSGLTCEVKFYFNDSTTVDGQIIPFEKDGFTNLSEVTGFNSCHVAFDLAGARISTLFENETILVKEE